MFKQISVTEALDLKNSIFIDVRSPKEYKEATIPNSINFPILTDEERVLVGIAHKTKPKTEAKLLGLKFASNKLEALYKKVLDLKKDYRNIIIFCWRGGMRSFSVCNILKLMDVDNVFQLNGGYKNYRKTVLNFFQYDISKFTFIVLHGLTGVGKTNILDRLENMGAPILNLELLASNAGSVFGDVLYNSISPSQKDFESQLFMKLYYNKMKFIITESESKRIGNINIPDTVMMNMEKGIHILIETNIDNRVLNIYNDYINQHNNHNPKEIDNKIIKALSHLNKRLGNDKVNSLISKIKSQNYIEVIRFLIEDYYDPLYKYSIEKIDSYDLEIYYNDINIGVKKIYNFLEKKFCIIE